MKKQMNFRSFMNSQVDFAAVMLVKFAKELSTKREENTTTTSYVYMSRKVQVLKVDGRCVEIKSGNLTLTR